MSQNVRTRFAPSPTGHLHIGNARTAVMNWIAARHFGGQFVLRIEDTDQERSTQSSEASILQDMQWLGLDWDEGPDCGGSSGPYRQSERLRFYQDAKEALIQCGAAYYCYCSSDELEARRKEQLERGEQPHYDGRCRSLTQDEEEKLKREGRQPSVRFRVSAESVDFTDLIKGSVAVRKEALSDFVIVRPDGMPMYNFACVADDHHMGITHVIRGDDHVSNTPRQILIYGALGWSVPQFAHIPMILGPDRNRLSKRHGATSVSQFRDMGYLSEALVNFLSLLSWSSPSGEELLSRDQLIREFSFDRISSSASVFDTEKLDWMNGVYIREKTTLDDLARLALPFMKNDGLPVSTEDEAFPVIRILQNKIEKLTEIGDKARIFFQENAVPENAEAADLLKASESRRVFETFLEETETLAEWSGEEFLQVMKAIQKRTGIKGKALWMSIRVALTGQMHGPELAPVAEFFGREKCRKLVQSVTG